MKVKEKTIVVTGGGNGLGRELVLLLLKKGANVVAADMNETTLRETFRLSGDSEKLLIYTVDITDICALRGMLEKAKNIFGTVDGVVNNAGIVHKFQKINDINFGVIEKVMNVNFYGTLNVCKVMLPHLLAHSEAHIVNVSSMGGFLPTAGQGVYCASKAAVKSLSEGLCAELSDTGVRVSVVFPGAMFTDIKNNSGLGELSQEDREKSKTVLQPRRAAEIIVRGMERNRKRIYVGNDAKTMNVLYRLAPGFAIKLIYKKIKHDF